MATNYFRADTAALAYQARLGADLIGPWSTAIHFEELVANPTKSFVELVGFFGQTSNLGSQGLRHVLNDTSLAAMTEAEHNGNAIWGQSKAQNAHDRASKTKVQSGARAKFLTSVGSDLLEEMNRTMLELLPPHLYSIYNLEVMAEA
jgi:hypothetical protein